MTRSKHHQIIFLSSILILAILFPTGNRCLLAQEVKENTAESIVVKLSAPILKSNFSLEQALAERRSIRNYTEDPLSLQEISQLLWAAQGITDSKTGHRTAPSAMATYPLELYLAVANVKDLSAGLYHYQPKDHQLILVKEGDLRSVLSQQSSVKEAPAVFLFTGAYEKIGTRFGDRAAMFVHLEAGHAAQNICLQATALHLGTVTVGGFDPVKLKESLALPEKEVVLYLLPVGKPEK